MGTLEIFLPDSHMASATESRNSGFAWNAKKAPDRAHGVGGISRVSAMAVVARNAVVGVDAPAPGFYRCPSFARLGSVALETDSLFLAAGVSGK